MRFSNLKFQYISAMDWRIKASLQKILAVTMIGDKLNHLPVTFNKKYHQNVFLYQTHECLRKFNHTDLDLKKGLIALEIGTGYSVISCVVLSLLGFKKIITVDVTKDLRFSTFKKQIAFIDSPSFLNSILAKSIYTEDEIKNRIDSIKEKKSFDELFDFLNVTYIAPYNFDILEKQSNSFDYISSQVVLEHIQPEILDELFRKTKGWLNENGFCVHTINFIDHFANPGFFQDKSISEFNFLKYSDAYWSFWTGNPIAYTNRLSHLYYLELCEKHNLKVVYFEGENYREKVPLNKNLIHGDILNKYSTHFEIEELTQFQRGTLVIKR